MNKATPIDHQDAKPADAAGMLEDAQAELKHLGREAASAARSTASRFRSSAKHALRSARRHTSDSTAEAGEAVRTAIGHHPTLTVGIALAAGVLIGALLGRRRH